MPVQYCCRFFREKHLPPPPPTAYRCLCPTLRFLAAFASMFGEGGHRHAMDAALPQYDGGGGNVVADEVFHNPMLKDTKQCTVDAPLPPRDDGGNGNAAYRDGDKPVRSRTLRARVTLAIGLAFELSSTVWAFWQSVSAGALDGDVDCGSFGRLAKLHRSSVVIDTCDGPVEADDFYNVTASLEGTSSSSLVKAFTGCDNLTDTLAGADSFQKLCICGDEFVPFEATSCSWVGLSSSWDGICFAQPLQPNSSEGTIAEALRTYNFANDCWASNPPGTMGLTITALVIALSSQVLEAVVGFKFWKDTDKRTAAFMLAASVLEALGVGAIAWVLLTLPGFFTGSGFFALAWITVPLVVVGALIEISAEYSDRAASRFPYLGAVGNGLIWLGAALLEVTVTSYVLWEGAGITNLAELALEAAGLFVLELLGLVSMWLARGLWTRAKVLSAPSVKRLESSLSKRMMFTRTKFKKSRSTHPISMYLE